MSGLNLEEIIEKQIAHEEKKLILIAAPTGSGKTYSSINFISKKILMSKDFRAFMVTTQVRTIPEDQFYNVIINKYEEAHGKFHSPVEKRTFFYRRVAVLKSLENSINDLLESQLPPILEDSVEVMQQFKSLKLTYARYQQQRQLTTDYSVTDYQDLKNAYWKVKDAILMKITQLLKITRLLSDSDKRSIATYVTRDETEFTHFLNRYFPMINIEQKQLILCTWSKFISSYQSFYSQTAISVSSPQCLGHAMIILDEIDEMKSIFVDKIIDDAIKIPIDALSLFTQIHSAVNQIQKKRSEEVMRVLHENGFSSFRRYVNTQANRYELDRDYKTIGVTYRTNFIFNLDSLTVTSGEQWWSKRDEKQHSVMLVTTKPKQQEDLNFSTMLRKIGEFFRAFIKRIEIWAIEYQKSINLSRQPIDNALSIENAIKTICDSLGLTAPSTKNLIVKMYRNHMKLKNYSESGSHSLKQVDVKYGHYLQRQGLNLTSLKDSDGHLNRTEINTALVENTPEKFILRLVNRGTVVGMSATVDIKTTLSNFDIGFLREQLGDRLIDGLQALPVKVKHELDVSERCRQNGMKTKIIEIRVDPNIMESRQCISSLIERRVPGWTVIPEKQEQLKQLEDIVYQLMTDVKDVYLQAKKDQPKLNDRTTHFIQQRYVELFDSFICFLVNVSMPTCLGLQSILPKPDNDPKQLQMSATTIAKVFDLLAELLTDRGEKIPQLRMIAKKFDGSVSDQIESALKLPAEAATRVYLLSAYKTLGVSQNLQYEMGAFEKQLALNIAPSFANQDDPRQSMVDIAGIYLGKITQLFTLIPDKPSLNNMAQWVRGYYELYSLVDTGETSLLEVRQYARKQNLGVPVRQFRQTMSYVGAHTRTVLQALGRLDRAFNKMPEITVMLGDSVLDYFNVSMKQPYQLGPIAQAMQRFQTEKKYIVPDDETFRLERYSNRTHETQLAVKKMVSALRTSEHSAQQYQTYREYLLAHPTVSFPQYHQHELRPEFAYLDDRVITYRVQRDKEEFTFKRDKTGNEVVSEQSSGLPIMLKYPGMSHYFKENKWAVTWEQKGFIMNPVQFDNYLGVLGEQAGKFIIEHEWHVKLKPLSMINNELFDFQTDQKILIDFKVWHYPHQASSEAERIRVRRKLTTFCKNEKDSIENWRVLIINVLESEVNKVFTEEKLVGGWCMEVPCLLNGNGDFSLNDLQKREVGEFLNGKVKA